MFNFPRKRVYSASLRITHNVSILLERCACIKVTHLTLNHGEWHAFFKQFTCRCVTKSVQTGVFYALRFN